MNQTASAQQSHIGSDPSWRPPRAGGQQPARQVLIVARLAVADADLPESGTADHLFQAVAQGAGEILGITSASNQLTATFRQLISASAPAEPPATAPRLTPRETEVLQTLARGYTSQEIGELLRMSYHTVNTHLKQIFRKLAVSSRSEAVFEALHFGLLRIEDLVQQPGG